VVGDLPGGGHEEEREVHTGDDEDHQAVEGHLAQHERPVVGEDLLEGGADEPRAPEAVVDRLDQAPDERRRLALAPVLAHRRFQ
jgi:hypothetical protein